MWKSKVYPQNWNLKELTFCKSRYHFIMWSRISSIFHDYALLHSLFTFAFIIYKNYSLSNTSQYHISIFIWKYIAVVWFLLIIRKPFTSKKWEHNKSLMIINFILRFIGKIPLLEHRSNVEKKQNGWIHLSLPHLKNTSTKLHPTASFQNTSYDFILWGTCHFRNSNKIQVVAWNCKTLIAKTFDSITLKLKAASRTKVIKKRKQCL